MRVILLLACMLAPIATASTPCYWEFAYGQNQMLGDEQTVQVSLGFSFPFQGGSYTTMWISSNGFLAFGPSNPGAGCCDADVAQFLAGPPRIAVGWHDMDPGVAGEVDFQSFGTRAVVTWFMVPESSSLNPHLFQAELFDTGVIHLNYDTLEPVSTGHRHHGLVGITPGGGAPDPGETDFSFGLPQTTAGGTIYEHFARGPNGATGLDLDPFDLSTNSLVFNPAAGGSWLVFDCSGAAIELRMVDAADDFVRQGGTGYAISVSAENIGVNATSVNSVTFVFRGMGDRSAQYTVNAVPGNPTVVASGATEVFQFTVDVDAMAALETIDIDASFDGVDLVSMQPVCDMGGDVPDQWTVLVGGCVGTGNPCGDCNSNGTGPDVIDALTGAQVAAGLVVPTPAQRDCCDVNGSGTITILDALGIAQLATALPVTPMCP